MPGTLLTRDSAVDVLQPAIDAIAEDKVKVAISVFEAVKGDYASGYSKVLEAIAPDGKVRCCQPVAADIALSLMCVAWLQAVTIGMVPVDGTPEGKVFPGWRAATESADNITTSDSQNGFQYTLCIKDQEAVVRVLIP